MYNLLRNILFLFDAEAVHHFSMNVFRCVIKIPFTKPIVTKMFSVECAQFQKKALGLAFKNNVGLAAGFDKNANYLEVTDALGFGFVEIGTVTPLPQRGNEKPRLFRIPKDRAIINRMGFNNEGVKTITENLKKWRRKNKNSSLIIGGNIGKNKNTPNEEAWKDYEQCFRSLFDHVDYFTINVSSPNTPGLRELQQRDSLQKIFEPLIAFNKTRTTPKPLLLKLSPDLNLADIDEIVQLAIELKLDGLVVSNTTISRKDLLTSNEVIQKIGSGGLSGKPLQKRSTDLIKYIADKSGGNILIMGSGGIFNAADANEKITAGATFVQVWTGFIYEGPAIVKKILTTKNYKN